RLKFSSTLWANACLASPKARCVASCVSATERTCMTMTTSHMALFLLALASLAGNYCHLPLPGGGDLLFGSIAGLLVVRFYGPWWGGVTALIAGSYTAVLWHHPYGLVLATCEALCVGLLWRRTRASFLVLDGLFWLCIGLPLLWVFSTVV